MAFRRASFPVTYPFILYYSQVVGAFAKSFIMFRMDRQKWTRQSAVGGKLAAVDLTKRLRTMSSTYMHALVLGWLVVAAAYFSHLL
jgi:glycosyltransferase Alg8